MTALATQDNIKLYESLVLKGDLSGLQPQEKAQYYQSLCERLGLDATTQPFSFLKLNGKEVLYASKGATDQLARVHGVNRTIIEEKEMRGVYVVTVEASLPNGRREQEKGAVTIENLKGDAFCNALMKAITKAKRRATLAILGLGLLDETELETIPREKIERPPTKSQLVEAVSKMEEPLNRQLSDVCVELNQKGDAVIWNKTALADYASTLFSYDPPVPNAFDLPAEEKQTLLEDLQERLSERKALAG